MNKGLKIKNDRSRINAAAQETKINEENFDDKLKEFELKKAARNKQAYELGTQFVGMLRDKTLSENRGPVAKQVEKEILTKLVALADEMNNDEHEREGAGSLTLETLFFKTMLVMRDRFNDLEFSIHQLKNSKLEKSEPEVK